VRQFELKHILLDADITAQVTAPDEGVHVLLTGGVRSHVGAVAMAQNGKVLACPSFPGHREQVVCERWAVALSQKLSSSATVACGIHYDNASPEQIEMILRICDELLSMALKEL